MGKPAEAKPKRARLSETRIELRADLQWLFQVDSEATRAGLNRSAFIRMAVAKEVDRAKAEARKTY
jgi:predicted DNA binding CopG/RHH family protein